MFTMSYPDIRWISGSSAQTEQKIEKRHVRMSGSISEYSTYWWLNRPVHTRTAGKVIKKREVWSVTSKTSESELPGFLPTSLIRNIDIPPQNYCKRRVFKNGNAHPTQRCKKPRTGVHCRRLPYRHTVRKKQCSRWMDWHKVYPSRHL